MIFHLAKPLTSHTNFKATACFFQLSAAWWSFFTSSVCGREAAVFNWSEKPTNKSVLQATCQMRAAFQTTGNGRQRFKGSKSEKHFFKVATRQSLKLKVSIFDKAQGQVIRCYTLKTSWKLKANLSHPFLEYTWKHSLKKTCAMRIILFLTCQNKRRKLRQHAQKFSSGPGEEDTGSSHHGWNGTGLCVGAVEIPENRLPSTVKWCKMKRWDWCIG